MDLMELDTTSVSVTVTLPYIVPDRHQFEFKAVDGVTLIDVLEYADIILKSGEHVLNVFIPKNKSITLEYGVATVKLDENPDNWYTVGFWKEVIKQ